ncbi:MAG TPA: stage V sporulation protein B [Clostridia bacterium]|nr:stage V sporulation protein B [Clostridia bacterium]
MRPQSFLYGAAVLFTASLFNKIVGFFYQIAIIRLIHAEGIGLFNMIYPIYVMLLVITSLGIPVSISKMVAEEVSKNDLHGAYRVFKISLTYIAVSAVLITIFAILGAPFFLKHIFANPDVYLCFLSLIPGIIIVSVCSAFRGFFQGLQQMTPTAVTQALEQLVRVFAGLFLAKLLLPQGIPYAAMGVSLGVIFGEFVGLASILYIYLRGRPPLPKHKKRPKPEPLLKVTRKIFSLGIPVTLTRFVSSGLMSVDAVIIPLRLQVSGLSLAEATSYYGQFIGIAGSLLLTPAIITISLATALIPAVSDAMAQKRYGLVQTRTVEALRLTLLAGLPCAAVFFVLPFPICGLLFGYREAGYLLQILALGGPFLYLHQTTTGILHGLGRADYPFKNMLIGSLFKLTGLYYLTALPAWGIRGTALAFSVSYVVMSLLNLSDLAGLTHFKLQMGKYVIKPVLASLLMGLTMHETFRCLLSATGSEAVSTSVALVVGLIGYVAFLFLLRCVEKADVDRVKELLNI